MSDKKLKPSKVLVNGLITENPTFRLVLGTCPTMAVTTSAINGIGMGLAATFVLICSNTLISLLRKIIPDKVRIPAYITIIATFVTVIDMLLARFVPSLYESLGLFIPLIVVNCIILGRAEAFASKNPVGLSALDGLGMGLGFTISLTALGIIREFLGAGAIFGQTIPFLSNYAMIIFILPAGGFLTFGSVMALINFINDKIETKKKMQLVTPEGVSIDVVADTEEVAPKAEAKVEVAPKTAPKAEVKAEVAPKEAPKAEVKAEVAPKEAPKAEAQAEVTPKEAPKAEAKVEVAPKTAESKEEIKEEPKVEVKAEPKAEEVVQDSVAPPSDEKSSEEIKEEK